MSFVLCRLQQTCDCGHLFVSVFALVLVVLARVTLKVVCYKHDYMLHLGLLTCKG